MTTSNDTDRHEDPPVRVTDAARIELEADESMYRCGGPGFVGHHERNSVGEQIDPNDFAAVFWQLFRSRTPQERDEAHTECERIARAAANRLAKLRAEHPI